MPPHVSKASAKRRLCRARDPFLAECRSAGSADFASIAFSDAADATHFTAVMHACQQLPDRAACLAPQLASSSLFTAVTGTTTFAAAASAGLGADKAKAAFLHSFRELLGAHRAPARGPALCCCT